MTENIQFVAVIANFAKNVFTEQDLIRFCQDVYRYRILGKDNSIDVNDTDIRVSTDIAKKSRRDKYSPFRQHHKLARRRLKSNGRECNVTLEYFNFGKNRVVDVLIHTGWKLDNLQTTSEWNNNVLHPQTASLDRIDSHKVYIFGSV